MRFDVMRLPVTIIVGATTDAEPIDPFVLAGALLTLAANDANLRAAACG